MPGRSLGLVVLTRWEDEIMKTVVSCLCLSILLAAGLAAQSPDLAKKETVYKPGPGITAPVVVKQVRPAYTSTAMDAKIQGSVPLQCVITAKGKVRDVKVVRSLDPGLDAEAVKAIEQWTFTPGKKDGKAVAVLVEVEMTFTLRAPHPGA
jgi:protein TonB